MDQFADNRGDPTLLMYDSEAKYESEAKDQFDIHHNIAKPNKASPSAEKATDPKGSLMVPQSADPCPTNLSFKVRHSLIDDDVRDAWATRGWTLRTSILRHKEEGLRELVFHEGASIMTESLEIQLRSAQTRLSRLSEVNR